MRLVGLAALVLVAAAIGAYVGVELWFRDTTGDVLVEVNRVTAVEPEAEDGDVDLAEAVEIAIRHAPFSPCPEEICRQVRSLEGGIPAGGQWAVVLSERIRADGTPTRTAAFLIDAATGATSTP